MPAERRIKEEPEKEPVSSAEDDDSEEVLSDTGQESTQEETDHSSKKPGLLNLTVQLQGQKNIFKSKILQKKGPSRGEEPKDDSVPSKEVHIKGMALSKGGAAKGKSQILQLASKTKTMSKTEEDQAAPPTKGPKDLLNRQSRMLFSMKGKGKDDKSKNAKKATSEKKGKRLLKSQIKIHVRK